MIKLEDFLVCMINCELNKTILKASQTRQINKTTQGFNKDVESLMILNTPDTPYKGIVCNQEICTKKSYNSQKIYRSGIGLLLYLVKHSQPELSNVVRKISKCMDKQNMSHYKDLLRAIKYIMDKKYYF